MSTIPDLQTLDAYVEARLGLIEELFAQIFGMFPPEAAEAFATGYNERRAAIIGHYKPEQLERELVQQAYEAEKAKKKKPSLVVVPSSNIILP
jgi:hypothetical protein